MPYELMLLNIILGAAGGDQDGAVHEFKVGNNVTGYDHTYMQSKKGVQPGIKLGVTDDTVMGIANAEATLKFLKDDNLKNDPKNLTLLSTMAMKEYAEQYPNGTFLGGYGGAFRDWVYNKKDYSPAAPSSYGGSCGDGSAMRVFGVAALGSSLKQIMETASASAANSHWDAEGIKGAVAIAAAIGLAKSKKYIGIDKSDFKAFLEAEMGYDLTPTMAQYRDYCKSDITKQSELCPTTVPVALTAFLENNTYEECTRTVTSTGGDTDTIGAMAGGIAGAFYGIPEYARRKIYEGLDDNLRKKLEDIAKEAKTIEAEPDIAEIENTLARARLGKYALDQYRQNPSFVPNKDPKYMELLAEVEATRLFYDEISKADLKDREDIKQALVDNKKSLVDQLKKDLIDNSAEFKEAYAKAEECPVKTVSVFDYDARIRKTGMPRTIFRETKAVVDSKMIPENIVKSSGLAHRLVEDGITKIEDAKKLVPVSENNAKGTDKQTIDKVTGEIKKYYSSKEIPAALKDVLTDLGNMKKTYKYDQEVLRSDVLSKLRRYSNELLLSKDLQQNKEALAEVTFVNGISDAVKDIPHIDLTEAQIRADEKAAAKEAKTVAARKEKEYQDAKKLRDKEKKDIIEASKTKKAAKEPVTVISKGPFTSGDRMAAEWSASAEAASRKAIADKAERRAQKDKEVYEEFADVFETNRRAAELAKKKVDKAPESVNAVKTDTKNKAVEDLSVEDEFADLFAKAAGNDNAKAETTAAPEKVVKTEVKKPSEDKSLDEEVAEMLASAKASAKEKTDAKKAEPDKAEKNAESNSTLEKNAIGFFKTSFLQTVKDLKQTNSVFSSDSDQYKKLDECLDLIIYRFEKHPEFTDNVDSFYMLSNEISGRVVDGKNIFQLAADYANAKSTQKDDLSDRQMERLNICGRLKTFGDILTNAKDTVEQTGKINDTILITELKSDTLAHKEVMGEIKDLGTASARNLLKDTQRYHKRVAKTKAEIKGNHLGEIDGLLNKSPENIADELAPKEIGDFLPNTFVFPETAEEKKEAKLAGAMYSETEEMLKTLANNDSLTHSKAYKNMKNGLKQFNASLMEIIEKGTYNREALTKAVRQAALAADSYQLYHKDQKAVDADSKLVQRAGVAAEIKLFEKLLENPDSTIEMLTQQVNDHNIFMKVTMGTRKKYKEYVAENDNLDAIANLKEVTANTARLGKNYSTLYKKLYADNYDEALQPVREKYEKVLAEAKAEKERQSITAKDEKAILAEGGKEWFKKASTFAVKNKGTKLPGLDLISDYKNKQISAAEFSVKFSRVDPLTVREDTPKAIKETVEAYNSIITGWKSLKASMENPQIDKGNKSKNNEMKLK